MTLPYRLAFCNLINYSFPFQPPTEKNIHPYCTSSLFLL